MNGRDLILRLRALIHRNRTRTKNRAGRRAGDGPAEWAAGKRAELMFTGDLTFGEQSNLVSNLHQVLSYDDLTFEGTADGVDPSLIR